MDKFQPDNFVLCEVPPLKYKLEYVSKNKLIYEFNGLLSSEYSDHGSGKFVIIRLNEIIRNVPWLNVSVAHFTQIYHENVHPNYRKGIPYLKFCYNNFSKHPMEQWTLCHLIVIHYCIKSLLEATPTIQQICTLVININLGLLIFIAPTNFRFLFDLIVRPNICLMCMYSTRNLKSRLEFLLIRSYVAYPIPKATLIRSAEINSKKHRKKKFPIEILSNSFPSIQSSTASSNCSIITPNKWRHRTQSWTALLL